MNTAVRNAPTGYSTARFARDVMTLNPWSIDQHADLSEAASLLSRKRISAAPVINYAGRPVGVLSRTDLVRHARGVGYSRVDGGTMVRDLMTPAVYSVRPDESLSRVVEELLHCQVHRVFVVSNEGILIGVISAFDLLRDLQAWWRARTEHSGGSSCLCACHRPIDDAAPGSTAVAPSSATIHPPHGNRSVLVPHTRQHDPPAHIQRHASGDPTGGSQDAWLSSHLEEIDRWMNEGGACGHNGGPHD